MRNWVDVKEGDWFYNEILEASSIILEDGSSFIAGIPYSVFEVGSPYIYEEFVGDGTKFVFTLSQSITPTTTNQLYVFIDGVQTVYKSVTAVTNGTAVELYVAPRNGSVVSFVSYGIPKIDSFGKPVENTTVSQLPNKLLDYGSTYYYNPFSRSHQEYLYAYGRALKRITILDSEWSSTSNKMELAKSYLKYDSDVYTVDPTEGRIYLPYNLNGVTCNFTYWSLENGVLKMRGGTFKATSSSMVYNNRFFPNALINRAEAYTLIDRLRKTFYSRFSDLDAPSASFEQTIVAYSGQRVFKLNGNYPAGAGKAIVIVNGYHKSNVIDYIEFDNHTILMNYPLEEGDEFYFYYNKISSDRFVDIGNGGGYSLTDGSVVTWSGSDWFNAPIMAMENETFNDGSYLINGVDIKYFDTTGSYAKVDSYYKPAFTGEVVKDPPERWFMPLTPLTRAEAVTFLNRFRKWTLERFK